MRKETVFVIPAAIRDSFLLKAVDQGERNVVVPEENRGLVSPGFLA